MFLFLLYNDTEFKLNKGIAIVTPEESISLYRRVVWNIEPIVTLAALNFFTVIQHLK